VGRWYLDSFFSAIQSLHAFVSVRETAARTNSRNVSACPPYSGNNDNARRVMVGRCAMNEGEYNAELCPRLGEERSPRSSVLPGRLHSCSASNGVGAPERARFAALILTAVTLLIPLASAASAAAAVLHFKVPHAGAMLKGHSHLAVVASRRVDHVAFYVDSVYVGSSTSRPCVGTWDSTMVTEGPHTITATGYDSTNTIVASASIQCAR
jgi:hypothetical protein